MKGIRKLYILAILLVSGNIIFGQSDSTAPLYVRFPNIPQFSIYNAKDSSIFKREDLRRKRPTVLILFSPDCEHCQHETKELEANIGKFKNAQILMVTYLSYGQMEKFYNDYHIANYPMITMGRDAKYFFPVYYKLRNMPSIFVYDKYGNFKKAFEGSVNVLKIAEQL